MFLQLIEIKVIVWILPKFVYVFLVNTDSLPALKQNSFINKIIIIKIKPLLCLVTQKIQKKFGNSSGIGASDPVDKFLVNLCPSYGNSRGREERIYWFWIINIWDVQKVKIYKRKKKHS